SELNSFLLNTGMMADKKTEQFKVWPTQLDRPQFQDVLTAGSRVELEKLHPLKRRKYARKPDPRPRMVEAYIYFYDELREFFLGTATEPPLKAEVPLASRLEECFKALKNALMIVVIDLTKDDDAQVIFETLNVRGEPLLPADLLRNYIFLRAARQGEPQEDLYKEFWGRFDDEFWRKEVRQGRLSRPRSDLLIQHYLASRLMVEIPIKHLFVEYRNWIERSRPFPTVRDELRTLANQGDAFRRILDPSPDDPLHPLSTFLDVFEIGTAHPLLLMLLDSNLSEQQWKRISTILESYILRRAVCGLSTKNYNRVFLSITKQLRDAGASPETLEQALATYSGESTEWPTDRAFQSAWKNGDAYGRLTGQRCVHVLQRLNSTYLDNKMEDVTINSPLTVEHLMPQNWVEHWPLSDGRQGLSMIDMILSDDEGLNTASERRHAAVQTIGNLTILTQQLNSAVSNAAWSVKKPAILKSSLLPINAMLQPIEQWDEAAIERRADELFRRAVGLWPAPSSRP